MVSTTATIMIRLASCAVSYSELPTQLMTECFLLDTWQPSPGTVRLAGGSDSSAGRVEVFMNGEWGTVCGQEFNITDAQVVCHQLGHSQAAIVTDPRSFGAGGGHVWLSNVNCHGNENKLTDCPSQSPSSCGGHSHDVGVVCNSEPY